MYADASHTGGRISEESIRLWGQHVREYVTSHHRFVARADAICAAAHDRLNEELRAAGVDTDPRLPAYVEAAARIPDETRVELRAVPTPETIRAEFDNGYTLVEQLAQDLRETEKDQADTIDQIEAVQLGLTRYAFYGR
jgi:hypothetical protein